jgi:hypothetical protein
MAVRCGTSIFKFNSRLVLSRELFLLVTSTLSSVVSFADNSRGGNQSPPRSRSAHQNFSASAVTPPNALMSLRCPSVFTFLTANLKLEFRVIPIRVTDLKFSNRKFFAISCVEEPRVYPGARGFHPAPPSSRPCLLATHHSSLATAFLIETPRLEFPATPTKQSLLQISNRDKNALFAPQMPAIVGIPRSTLVVSLSLTQETQ